MSSDSIEDSNVANNLDSQKWHKNYTRLMPYYYVNHKAKLKENGKKEEEKIVRVRKVVKNKTSLNLEVAEKDNARKRKQKILNKQNIIIPWEEIEEISLNLIKSRKWTLTFIK